MLEALVIAEKPMSAEEVHAKLYSGTCDLVTVYRSLEQFERVGVVQLGVRENGTKVYCLSHGLDHHHHLTCRICGRTERVGFMHGGRIRKELRRSYGFTELSHVMELFGACPECKKEA